MKRFILRYGFLIIIIALIIARFAVLPFSPPGFYIDEAASGAHVVAMLHHGTDAHGTTLPLFSPSLGGGYTTAPYLYPLVAWAAIFGTSEVALRSFSMFVTIVAILIIGLSLRYWLGRRYSYVAVIVGLALPWSWLQGSLAWDPVMVPLCISLALLGFTLIWFRRSPQQYVVGTILLPLALILAAYVYPPCRVTAPLLFALAYVMLLQQRKLHWKVLLPTIVGSLVLALPLAFFMFQPDALDRSKNLSVFYDHSIIMGLVAFGLNALMLLNPLFLFITGDANLRHSTGLGGMLGIGSILPLVILFILAIRYRHLLRLRNLANHPRLVVATIGIVGVLAALIGSALTNEGQPHSLRATAAWPFFVVLITLGWGALVQMKRRVLTVVAVIIFATSTIAYSVDLAFIYPERAHDSFDVSIREQIAHDPAASYDPLALYYYQNR